MDVEEAIKLLAQSVQTRSKWREDAREDFAFVAGHQWKDEHVVALDNANRPHVVYNTIAPIADAISGHEIANRQEVSYMPRQAGNAGVNEVLTAAAEWVREECDAEQEESDAFYDATCCGEGWTSTEIDYDIDLDGRIEIRKADPLEMDRDPNSTQKNYADAKWVCRSKVYDVKEAMKLWPDADESAFEPPDDKREPYSPVDVIAAAFYRLDSGKGGRKGSYPNKCVVHDFQWYEHESIYRVDIKEAMLRLGPERSFMLMQAKRDDESPLLPPEQLKPDDNGLITLDSDTHKLIKDLFDAAGIKIIKQKRRLYKRMYFTGETELETSDTPTKDSFTYKAITAKRDRKNKCWYGIVRAMKDPQKWANKFMSTMLEILGTSGKGGILYESGTFADPRAAEEDWADPSKNIEMIEGAIASQKVMPRPQTQLNAGFQTLMDYSNQAIKAVAGVNPEVMGLSEAMDPNGVMEEGRRQSGLNMLAYLFDGLRRYRKEQGRLLLKMITTYIPQGRLIRVVGQDGAQYVPLVYDPQVTEYDVVVDESPTSVNVKEKTWNAFMAVATALPQMITPQTILIAIDYSPMPSALVQKLKDAAKQAQTQGPPPIPPPIQAKMQVDQATAQLRTAQAQDIGQKGQRDMAIAQIDAAARGEEAHAEVVKSQADAAGSIISAQAQAQAARAKVASDSMQHINDGLKIAAQAHQTAHQTAQTTMQTIQEGHKTVQAMHKTKQTLTMPKKPKGDK